MTALARLQELDARLATLPMGTIEVHARGEERVAFRVRKYGPSTSFERIGLEGSREHVEAQAQLDERRTLSAQRRLLARELL